MAVTEIGRRSPGPVTIEALGTGVIVAVLQVRGTFCRVREKLTSLATTGPSSTAHNLYNQIGFPSGSGDVDLTLPSTVINSSSLNGLNEAESLCLVKSSRDSQVHFESTVRPWLPQQSKHSNHLPSRPTRSSQRCYWVPGWTSYRCCAITATIAWYH